ncbi:hypothetical protein AVEN_81451-1 [Araneus ventricosus]|uniref:Uncharacterized protein n=1 Tax=Araneus ventricosus TaxID=182803 RepID=A0A4Y2RJE6_ARAVE|nr:hypothetical protein AVEN_252761-1 [Araneus ventricosus]GBN75761.1 hypothetical protein AVEN_81451-1 [Araneus ventricosus]
MGELKNGMACSAATQFARRAVIVNNPPYRSCFFSRLSVVFWVERGHSTPGQTHRQPHDLPLRRHLRNHPRRPRPHSRHLSHQVPLLLLPLSRGIIELYAGLEMQRNPNSVVNELPITIAKSEG